MFVAELDKISLENEYFEEAQDIYYSESKENEYSPIDFRSLSVQS